MNNVVLSTKYPIFAEKLTKLGYNVISSEQLSQLIPYEQDHADIQCLILDNTAFILRECTTLAERLKPLCNVVLTADDIGAEYPKNVRLNTAVIGKNVIARLDSLDNRVKSYCQSHGYRLINVRQGYAGCSCAVVSDHALITADNGVFNSLKEYKIDVLRIEQGRVSLKGVDYGFIGGASGLDIRSDKRILYFTGDIKRHPSGSDIEEFCKLHDTEIWCLTDAELTDIGGMIFC